jgi:sterol desaturase/sphingolipid hydroxylase (fatty acid hydroxylase superfamily)
MWDELQDILDHYSADGYSLALGTFVLTILLELGCLAEVRAIWTKQRNGKSLYLTAIVYNVVNHFLLGVPIYGIALKFLTRPMLQSQHDHHYSSLDDSFHGSTMAAIMVLVPQFFTILFVHSLLYYYFHKFFHEHARLYRIVHQFHHRFKEHVTPMVANAVTPMEYIVAYVIPIAAGAMVARPDPLSLKAAVTWLTVTNLFVHMPRLQALSVRYVPQWCVTTADHLEHHQRVLCKYASPTFNVDYFVGKWKGPLAKTR